MDWAHIRGVFRQERCGQSFGMCSSDTFHLGLRGVAPGGKAHEFGGKIDTRKPDQCAAWRAMRDKAKADIQRFDEQNEIRSVAKSRTKEQINKFVEACEQWANSLLKTNL
jgi:hypothetical protein